MNLLPSGTVCDGCQDQMGGVWDAAVNIAEGLSASARAGYRAGLEEGRSTMGLRSCITAGTDHTYPFPPCAQCGKCDWKCVECRTRYFEFEP